VLTYSFRVTVQTTIPGKRGQRQGKGRKLMFISLFQRPAPYADASMRLSLSNNRLIRKKKISFGNIGSEREQERMFSSYAFLLWRELLDMDGSWAHNSFPVSTLP